MDKNKKKKKYSDGKYVIILANCTWYLYNFRLDLLKELKKKGFKLILVSTLDKYYNYISEYFVETNKLFLIRGSENLFFELITIFNIFYCYLKYKPKLVHHFTIKPAIYGSLIARFICIKNVINHITGLGPSFYSNRFKIKFFNNLLKPIYKYAFNNKKSICIFHNSNDRDTFIDQGLISPKNTTIIKGSGVEKDHFNNKKLKDSFNNKIQILFPGRIIREKGIVELIDACNELWQEEYKFTLNIAGEIDKHNKSSLQEKNLKKIIINKNINVIGKSENMYDIYQSMDIVVLPSWREGLSKSLLEAASMSLPIITTDVPGCNDVIIHKYSGILVPARDKNALKNAIKDYLKNPSYALKYGRNARKYVIQNFTVQKINQEIIKLYKNFLNKND